jgi:hypothetical protein
MARRITTPGYSSLLQKSPCIFRSLLSLPAIRVQVMDRIPLMRGGNARSVGIENLLDSARLLHESVGFAGSPATLSLHRQRPPRTSSHHASKSLPDLLPPSDSSGVHRRQPSAIACLACTFLNHPFLRGCEMCATDLPWRPRHLPCSLHRPPAPHLWTPATMTQRLPTSSRSVFARAAIKPPTVCSDGLLKASAGRYVLFSS